MDTMARVRELMNEKDLSLHKLSILSEVSYSTLKNTEIRRGQLKVETIEKLCHGLGISMAEFFTEEGVSDDAGI